MVLHRHEHVVGLFQSTPDLPRTPLWSFLYVRVPQTHHKYPCTLSVRLTFRSLFCWTRCALPSSRDRCQPRTRLQLLPVPAMPERAVAEEKQAAFHDEVRVAEHLGMQPALDPRTTQYLGRVSLQSSALDAAHDLGSLFFGENVRHDIVLQ